MSAPSMSFEKSPIVEAIVDIDCDFVPGFVLTSLEEAGRAAFCDVYPKMQKRFLHGFPVALKPGAAASQSSRHGLQAFQFLRDDLDPTDWDALSGTLQGLCTLTNRIFRNTLENKCLERFQ